MTKEKVLYNWNNGKATYFIPTFYSMRNFYGNIVIGFCFLNYRIIWVTSVRKKYQS